MTYSAPSIRKFEKKYVERLEQFANRSIDHEAWWEALGIFFDWQEEEEEGSPEWRAKKQESAILSTQYVAWCLRNDLDGSWHLHPYPRAVTARLKKLWPLAQYFYMMDDASGFLGPSAGEMVYLARAISASRKLGNTDFEDLPLHLDWWTAWYDVRDAELDNPEFRAWLAAGEHDWMFHHRGTKEEWETRSLFVSHDDALQRNRARREKEQHESPREAEVDDGALRPSE